MLPVAVDRDDAAHLGQIVEHIAEGRFQRAALAAVIAVVEHRDGLVLSGLGKIWLVRAVAAIVHHDDLPEALLKQPVDNAEDLFIRVQTRQHDGQRLLGRDRFRHSSFLLLVRVQVGGQQAAAGLREDHLGVVDG